MAEKSRNKEKGEAEAAIPEGKKYEFWTDQIAHKVLERKKFLYLDKDIDKKDFGTYNVKTSASISGVLHIGRLSDTIRGEAVTRSLIDASADARIFWVAEDMDPLRKIPEGVPASYAEYIGAPVTDIPDPQGCHKSYAEHHTSKYFEVIDKFVSLKMDKFSMREEYKKGNFNPYIKRMMESKDKLIEIQNKFRDNKLADTWNPWTPICKKCGKIITTKVTGSDEKTGKVKYRCEDYAFETQTAKGCGYEGENDPLKGEGKMMWKAEWAAQWARWKVCAEGAGKEYQVPGSAFWVNCEICENVLGFPAPVPIFYEHLIINGQKMSASLGNVVYPNEWLKYAPAEVLRLLFLKDPMRTRDFRWDVLPNMMDELDDLEKVYFGEKEIESERDRYNMRRLFEVLNLGKPGEKYVPKAQFSTLLEIAKTAPKEGRDQFVLKKLGELGLLKTADKKGREQSLARLKYVLEFMNLGRPMSEGGTGRTGKIELTAVQKEKIGSLIKAIEDTEDAESLQAKVFEISKSSGGIPGEFFKAVYRVLFGEDRGPRLGAYIIDSGKGEVLEKLKAALKG